MRLAGKAGLAWLARPSRLVPIASARLWAYRLLLIQPARPLSALLYPLALLGRYGTQGFALSIFLGLALPQFAEAARPLLPITIFLFVAMTFARADFTALKAALRKPWAVMLAVGWLMLAPALMIVAIFAVVPREALDPGLVLGLVIIAAAPPIMSGPAVAMMLNIEPTVLIAATIITTTAAPFVAPPLAEFCSMGRCRSTARC